MSDIETGGPAYPTKNYRGGAVPEATGYSEGKTLREYAAIHLMVPNSGKDWLDDMIRKAQRDQFAAKAMQALVTADQMTPRDYVANDAYGYADAMLKARES
jgi:hypothetical protein